MHAEQATLPGFSPPPGRHGVPAGGGGDADRDGLRPYQRDAVTAISAQLRDVRSTLLVMATGLGKTQTFGALAKHWPGRVLVLAHRDELLEQARRRLEAMTGELVDLEQAEWRASGSRMVVGSVQTLSRLKRLQRFKANAFDLVVVDEAHHAVAASYRRVLNHFAGAKVLGVTATPDRGDERAMGLVFDTVAYRRDIEDGIADGFLCPVRVRSVHIDSVDLAAVRTVAGDLNSADLEAVMSTEGALHGVAQPLLELTGDRRTIVFHGPTVANAHRLTEVLNRYRPGFARCVDGTTPDDERKAIFRAHKAGEFSALVNVGIATEGYDDPGISCVALARMTKSRALYAQMAGRGLRIAEGKPDCLLLDFVGNAGRHVLVSPFDILGGRYDEAVVKRAKTLAEKTPGMRADEALDTAQKELKAEAEKAAAKRAAVKASVRWRTESKDPFRILGIADDGEQDFAPNNARLATPAQVEALTYYGLEAPVEGWRFNEASRLIGTIKSRKSAGLASFKTIKALRSVGVNAQNMYQTTAGRLMAKVKENKDAGLGWRITPGQVAEIVGSGREPGEEG